MLSAVQIFNNPLITFKTESFIVLSVIAWTYLLHAHYRRQQIEYRYFTKKARKRFERNSDGKLPLLGTPQVHREREVSARQGHEEQLRAFDWTGKPDRTQESVRPRFVSLSALPSVRLKL